MKGRSQHRLPISNPPDDWVEESWTVDCVCGVNFDDGEEMVNCDECGVWVHTRCSLYLKGEASFHCDKCKTQKNTRNDSCEETEVAQLLVELPTKTMRMENSCHLNNHPPRRPFRLWTDRPIEERVHVQGIPGGDPTLFKGLKSVFTRELWSCSGYVPKKFNFQYREFPCWEEKQEPDDRTEEENENPVSRGAGVLFSLSKETMLATPMSTLVGLGDQAGEGGSDRTPSLREMKKRKGEDEDNIRRVKSSGTKERNLLRPSVIQSSKRKKEVQGTSKDRSGKRKTNAVDGESDAKKRGSQTANAAFTPFSDAKQMEFYKGRGPKFLKSDPHSIKSCNTKDTVAREPISDSIFAAENNLEKHKNMLASTEYSCKVFSSDLSRHNNLIGAGIKAQISATTDSYLNTDDGLALPIEENDVGKRLGIEEGVSITVDKLDENGGHCSSSVVINLQKSEPLLEELATAGPEIKDNQPFPSSTGDMSKSAAQSIVEVKMEEDFDNPKGVSHVHSSPYNDIKLDETNQMAQLPGTSGDHMFENVKVINAVISSSHSSDPKVQDVDRSSDAVNDCHIDKSDDLSGDPFQFNSEFENSKSSLAVLKSSFMPKHGSELTEEPSKLGVTVSSPSVLPHQHNMVANVEKCSSPPDAAAMSKSFIYDNCKTENSLRCCAAKHRVMPNCNVSMKREHAANDAIRDEDRHQTPRKTITESLKSSVNTVSKGSHLSKISHPSVSQKTLPDLKDPNVCSSSKAYTTLNVAVATGIGESVGSLQTQNTLPAENKMSTSGLPQRGDRFSQSSGLPFSKANHASSMHPFSHSKAPARLSDEELALLLHQELNSSPRVPRVPRVRQAGSLPQLASPAATSMLIKRSCSSGGKDNSLVSRRRNKDVSKDGPRSSREIDDEAKKIDGIPPSPDQKKPDLASTTDATTHKNMYDDSLKVAHFVTNNVPPPSTRAANSGPSSSMETNNQNLSSVRNSPRNISDDDTGTTGVFSHQTLPGLISEIMSKGMRMTYEELCNAVLPHWHSLRKHNGERYAYSSHSQAVLDCLRNRSEWSQLVDRGPKTNGNKKRRKHEAEPPSVELEDNDVGKNKTAKETEGKNLDSHRDEFPKGKRKARKRRRLALQGAGIKDVRKIRKVDMLTDDDIGPFSNSSEESMFSEDEIQEGGTRAVGSEASASSDETGAIP